MSPPWAVHPRLASSTHRLSTEQPERVSHDADLTLALSYLKPFMNPQCFQE